MTAYNSNNAMKRSKYCYHVKTILKLSENSVIGWFYMRSINGWRQEALICQTDQHMGYLEILAIFTRNLTLSNSTFYSIHFKV